MVTPREIFGCRSAECVSCDITQCWCSGHRGID
uniref:Uncharacterized protein n=1 Tax=Anguilla anguilla TaxID=7936 RepID=A0A0E9TDX9_ANGAN